MKSYKDIPQLPRASYTVDVAWAELEERVAMDEGLPFVLEPDYQRGHVWTADQQSAFVEYGLMGGENSMNITTNCPGWMGDWKRFRRSGSGTMTSRRATSVSSAAVATSSGVFVVFRLAPRSSSSIS